MSNLVQVVNGVFVGMLVLAGACGLVVVWLWLAGYLTISWKREE
jgi:hypothetical protein